MGRKLVLAALAAAAVLLGREIARTCSSSLCSSPPCVATTAVVCSLESRTVPPQASAFSFELDLVFHNASITCPQPGGAITVQTLAVAQNDAFVDASGFSFAGFPAVPFSIAESSSVRGKLRVYLPASPTPGRRRFDVSLGGFNAVTLAPVASNASAVVDVQPAFRVEALGGIRCGFAAGADAQTIYRVTNLIPIARNVAWTLTSHQISTSTTADHFPVAQCGTTVPCGDPSSTVPPALAGNLALPAVAGAFVDVCIATRSFAGCYSCASNDYDFVATDQFGKIASASWNYTVLAAGWGGIEVQPASTGAAAGAGGAIPSAGSGGGGAWPSTLPPSASWFESTAVVPSTWTHFVDVELYGVAHTWIGDLQVVLVAPSGQGFTLVHRPGFTGANAGSSGDMTGGDYAIVDPSTPGAASVPFAGAWNGGTYKQSFGSGAGAWPSGVQNIVDQALASIAPAPGAWKLRVIDWAAGDQGACTGWAIHGRLPDTPANSYCTASTTTHGCSPRMMAVGMPSASASSGFYLCASHVEGQKAALLFYGVNGTAAYPWGAGSSSLLCVEPPVQRMVMTVSSGSSSGCDGVFQTDWNAFAATHPTALGIPRFAGEIVDAQGWFRDPPAPKTTNLTDAIEFVVQP